jgi:hypothetical protein
MKILQFNNEIPQSLRSFGMTSTQGLYYWRGLCRDAARHVSTCRALFPAQHDVIPNEVRNLEQ